jgi:hypothetical protein
VAWSVLGGVGAGIAYGGTVAKALKQFTDRKALAVGVTAAACAGVLALALGAAVSLLSSAGALPMLVVLGAAQAVVIVVATLFILYPSSGAPPPEW